MYNFESFSLFSRLSKERMFKVEDLVIVISKDANMFLWYIMMEFISPKTEFKVPDYFTVYSIEHDEFIWDYDILSIDVVKKYKDDILSIGNKSEGKTMALIRKDEGYFTLQRGGDEDPRIRKTIEKIFRNNKEEILETIDMIKIEQLLD